MLWLSFLVVGVLLGGCSGLKAWLLTHQPRPRVSEPSWSPPSSFRAATPTGVAPGPSPTPAPTARHQRRVCTGYDAGALNVRACPGTNCWVLAPLYEGQVVVPDGQEARTADGATWMHIAHPVDGWVNAKYLCTFGDAQ